MTSSGTPTDGGRTAEAAVHILAARLQPPHPGERPVDRPRVDARLDQAVQGRLSVVCAGPGWGKTTAVGAWLARSAYAAGLRVAWLTLEPADDDPVGFWQGVLDAVAHAQVAPTDHPLLRVRPNGALSGASLRTIYRGFEALPQPMLLVLDDFQLIRNREILEQLNALLRYSLPVRLLVLTRVDPNLARHRLRLDAAYDEIRADVLGFTVDEVLTLARVSDVDLTPDDAASLVRRTEGWPAGVRLALLYLRGDDRRTVDTFLGEDRSVAEYLVAEVLGQLSPRVREFMLATSVCARLDADLAAAIHPESPAHEFLDALARGNYFVDRSGVDGGTYRYHQLLREMLVARLRRDDPLAYRLAHNRAARLLAGRGEGVRALEHAAEAWNWPLLGEIVVDVATPEILGPRRPIMLERLAQVPAEEARRSAPVALSVALLATMQGRFPAARSWVDVARDRLTETATEPSTETVLLSLVSAGAARLQGDAPGVLADGRAAERQIAAVTRTTPAMDSYAVLASLNMAVGALWTGDLATAEQRLMLLHGAGLPDRLSLSLLNARSYLAFLHLLLRRLADAEAVAAEAIDEAERRGWTSHLQLRLAHVTRALVADLRGEAHAAGRHLAAALASEVGGTEQPVTGVLHLARTSVALAAGHRLAAARAWGAVMEALDKRTYPAIASMLERVRGEMALLDPDGDVALPRGLVPMVAEAGAQRRLHGARVHLLRGNPAAAVRVVGADDDVDPDPVGEVERLLVLAAAYDRLGRRADADRAAHAAVEAARPMSLRRPFLAPTGASSRDLVRRIAAARSSDGFAASLVSPRDRAVAPEPALLVDPLTERELAILGALSTMQSNEEIARDFYISVNTVKAHLKALYRKLSVGSRREAVRRGRELSLIP
jgi:LuxR family transcriptional regulator, maltose regulon positive regulatory protein